jgi:hypothetical protein
MARPLAAASALALATLTACDALGPYPGEPRAELTVTITDTRVVPSRPIFLGVSWFLNPYGHEVTDPEVKLMDALPATIPLRIYKTPPLTELRGDALPTEFKLGVGVLIAWVDDDPEMPLRGMDRDHYVIFAPSDVPAGSFASKLLHGTPGPGFHIYAPRQLAAGEADDRQRCYFEHPEPTWEVLYEKCGGHPAYQEIHPVPTGLATPLSIEVSDFIESLDELLWHST